MKQEILATWYAASGFDRFMAILFLGLLAQDVYLLSWLDVALDCAVLLWTWTSIRGNLI